MKMVLAAAAVVAVTLGAACARRVPVTDGGALPAHAMLPVDTIVLVRTRCFGRCPAYEVVIPRGGRVRVTGDADRVARAVSSVPDDVIDRIAERARTGGFYTLPAETRRDPGLCPLRATDHPSVTVRLVQGRVATQVEDYTGCYQAPQRRAPVLEELEALARAIDAAAGTGDRAP